MTAHTTNVVPLTIVGAGKITLKSGGKLCDIAPTMLELLGIEKTNRYDRCIIDC